MEIKLDHIVHFINQHPKEAVMEWKKHSFNAVMGGSHDKWGTFNSLLYVGDSYIEFLAIENQCIASKSDNPLISQLVCDLPKGEGISQICFRTNDIISVKKQLLKKGCQTYPIFNGSRIRQDGSTIKWKMLFIKETQNLPYPFFIEWDKTDGMRMRELKELDLLDENLLNHSIQTIQIVANDCEKSAKDWANLFDFTLIDILIDTNTAMKRARLKAKSVEIIFCEPLNHKNPIHKTLEKRGERPFEIHFIPSLKEKPISIFNSVYK